MAFFTEPEEKYGGYIFDCDGTLANSMPLHMRAWNTGLQAAGAPFTLEPETFMGVAGMALKQTIQHWNETHQTRIDEMKVIDAKNAFFEAHFDDITPIPEIIAFAQSLRDQDIPISVASGGRRDDVFRTLKHVGIPDLFDIVVTADDVACAKPAPDLFLEAARRMQVDPRHCLVIEDSPLGVEAAHRAGMQAILLPTLF